LPDRSLKINISLFYRNERFVIDALAEGNCGRFSVYRLRILSLSRNQAGPLAARRHGVIAARICAQWKFAARNAPSADNAAKPETAANTVRLSIFLKSP